MVVRFLRVEDGGDTKKTILATGKSFGSHCRLPVVERGPGQQLMFTLCCMKCGPLLSAACVS